MQHLEAKIRELERRYGELATGQIGKAAQVRKTAFQACHPVLAAVVDNRDPECLGRIRVSQEMFAPGSVSVWLPIVGHWKKKESGWWALPEIGVQALVIYTLSDRSEGYVLGFIYDELHRVPKGGAKSTLLQTKKHRIEIIEEEGKEEILIESKAGKMRCQISKGGSIQLVNELGDIRIRCRNIKIEGREGVCLKAGGKIEISSEGNFQVKASKKAALTGEEVSLKGKNIRLNGSRGVTAKGKQVAKQNDRVVGFDTHIMVILAGTGTANVPLPHPFIGQIKGKVSSNVKMGYKGVATKGSVARHDDSMHLQLPGTIQFLNSPKKEGEVTGGTIGEVKVNGKEVAVVGSLVSTCNDVGMRDNSTIVALGASIPMPMIIHPKNTAAYQREQDEAEKKEPRFSSVRWSKNSCEEGEEVELTASVQDIADGNMVTLQVFPEGSGPENGTEYARFPLTVKKGAVSAKWKYKADHRELPPESNPRFIFSAHSAWCNYAKSSNSLEVKLIRPEITKAEWQDAEGNVTSKGLVGQPLKLVAETKDIEGGVTFWIYDENRREVASLGADIVEGRAEVQWTPTDPRAVDDTRELRYNFEATGNRCKKVTGGEVQVRNPRVVSMEWDKKAIYYGDRATLRIKTLEVAQESPSCRLQLWERDYTTEDDLILERDITIDGDEVETEIEFNFDVERVVDEEELELEIIGRLQCGGNHLPSEQLPLLIKFGGRTT